jgi:fibronectin-binding autotransporter adhesin
MYALVRLRATAPALALLAALAAPQTASAQYTWALTGNGEWLAAGSWSPAGGPPSGVGAIATFGNAITTTATVTISGGAVTVGELGFGGITGTKAYTIGAAGNTITLSGGAVALTADANNTGTGTQTILANVAASAGSVFGANIQSGTIHVSGQVSGTAGLTKAGAGTLILSGNNTGLTGGIAVNGGTVEVRGTNTGPSSGMGANAVTVNAGGQLAVNSTGFWEPTNALTIAGKGPAGAPLYSDAALWFRGTTNYYKGPIALSGDASLRLDGAFIFRGSANKLTLNGHEARFTGVLTTVGQVNGVIEDGAAAGGRVRIDIDRGDIGFTVASTYTGATVIDRGILFIYHPQALGPGLGTAANGVTVNTGGFLHEGELYLNTDITAPSPDYTVANKLLTLNGGAIVRNGANKTWTGAVTLTANSIIGSEGPAGTFTFTGGINLNANTLTLRPNFDHSVITITTNGISGTGGVTVIPVTGVGTVNLNATSTYQGPTLIQSHRVYANATQATGTGAVTINGGNAQLRGTGSITGSVTITNGALAPGGPTTPGTLTLNGGLSLASTGIYRVRLVSNTSFDSTLVSGPTATPAVLGNATLSLDLSGATSTFNVGTDKLYILKMASDKSLQAGTTFNLAEGAAAGSSTLYTFYVHYDYAQGGGVYLIPQPVPEPGLVLGVAAGALGLWRMRRRSARRA